MSSGSYILSEIGLEVGDQPSSFTKLMLSKTAQWTPTINDSVIAIEDVAKGIELVTATTIKTKVTYSKMFFDTLSGVAGKKLVPDNLQLSRYEETLSKDLNGDGLIANLRVQMGNSVYDLVLTPDAWVTAKALADKSTYFDADSNSTIKGSLLSINSQEELDNVMEFVTPFLSKLTAKAGIDGNSIPYLWTSATDAVKEAIWLWSDNTPISLTDTHWNEKPETYTLNKQDYLGVALTNSADGSILAGQWNDLLGTNKLAYIIEYTLA
jgi:hypothetical protein